MVMKVTVYVSNTEDQVFGPGYDRVWSTVREEGTASQMIANFLDTTKQIAARLEDNTASVSEEIAVTQFLVELGAVVLEVLPLCTDSEKPNETQENKTVVPQDDNKQTKENQIKENVSKKESNQNEENKHDKSGSNIKDEPANTNGVKIDTYFDSVNGGSDTSDFGGPDDNSSDTEDYMYEEHIKEQPCTSKKADIVSTSSTRKRSSRLQEKKMTMMKSDKTFSCLLQLCSSKFSSRNSILVHLKGKHRYSNDKAVEILQAWYKPLEPGRPKRHKPNDDNDDSATIKEKKIKIFSSDVKTKPFVCSICKAGYPRRMLLKSHLCEMHGFTKETSDAEIATVYGVLRSHRRPKLPDSMFYSVDIKLDKSSNTQGLDSMKDVSKATGTKPTCPKCGKEFDRVSNARVHFENDCTNNPLECNICGSNFESIDGYKLHMTIHENKEKGVEYKCQTCDKVLYHKYMLTQHEATHESKFICDFCGKSYPQNCLLQRHRNKHTKEKTYACPKCPKVYWLKHRLNTHIANVHEGNDLNITCHVCGKMVKQSCMRGHFNNWHSRFDYITCPIRECGKAFKRQKYLEDHMKEVHKGGGGDEYPCTWPKCSKVFVRKKGLKAHMDVHNDVRRFSCTLCDKKFRTKRNLQVHTNWHQGIRSHQCQLCEKSFLIKGNLTKHMVTHKKRTSMSLEMNIL